MKLKNCMIGAALLSAGLLMTAPQVSAAVATPGAIAPQAQMLLDVAPRATPVQYGYCRRAYRLCRYRWGYGWRFRRCMHIRGCL